MPDNPKRSSRVGRTTGPASCVGEGGQQGGPSQCGQAGPSLAGRPRPGAGGSRQGPKKVWPASSAVRPLVWGREASAARQGAQPGRGGRGPGRGQRSLEARLGQGGQARQGASGEGPRHGPSTASARSWEGLRQGGHLGGASGGARPARSARPGGARPGGRPGQEGGTLAFEVRGLGSLVVIG